MATQQGVTHGIGPGHLQKEASQMHQAQGKARSPFGAGNKQTSAQWPTQTGTTKSTKTDLGPGYVNQKSNYELFNCNNFNIH